MINSRGMYHGQVPFEGQEVVSFDELWGYNVKGLILALAVSKQGLVQCTKLTV
jgi:hypothetical protein